MTFLTLFSDEHSWLATDQRVFSADELQAVTDAVDQVQQLSAQIAAKSEQTTLAVKQGAESGYQEGQERARLEAQQQSMEILATLHNRHEQEIAEQRRACATLAIDIVRKIAANVAPADWLYAQAMQAATEIIDQPNIVLRVNTAHVDAIRARCTDDGEYRFNEVVADNTLAVDACVLETSMGKIDVDLDTQLSQIEQLFVDGTPGNG